MTNKIVVALACLGLAATARAGVDFDQNIDVNSVVEQAKSSDVKAPYPYYGHNRVRFSKDCRSVHFGPSSYAQSSERLYLTSTEYIEECRFVPRPPKPPPVNPPKPPKPPKPDHPGDHHKPDHHKSSEAADSRGSHDGPHGDYTYSGHQGGQDGTWHCHERRGREYRATAQVNVAQRDLYPWESESFSVCMEADRLDLDTRKSPYRYHVDRQGMYDVNFNLTPNYRTPTDPDPSGLSAAGFAFRNGKFVLSVNDRWAREYAGEKVEIKVELFKDGFLFFNSSKGEKTFTFDAAGSYELAFAEGDLAKTKDFVDDSTDFRGPKKYFVKWGFRRIGSISTRDYVKKGSTDKITK